MSRGQAEPFTGATSVKELLTVRDEWRRRGEIVVWTNGCFDLLHPGHLAFLTQAQALGDVLIVGVNDDASVRRLKGPSRPFVPLAGRVAMLNGLRVVDHVIVLEADTPVGEVDVLRPDVCCKDFDYASLPLPERAVVEAYGGRMLLLPRVPGWSTTSLAERACRATPGKSLGRQQPGSAARAGEA